MAFFLLLILLIYNKQLLIMDNKMKKLLTVFLSLFALILVSCSDDDNSSSPSNQEPSWSYCLNAEFKINSAASTNLTGSVTSQEYSIQKDLNNQYHLIGQDAKGKLDVPFEKKLGKSGPYVCLWNYETKNLTIDTLYTEVTYLTDTEVAGTFTYKSNGYIKEGTGKFRVKF